MKTLIVFPQRRVDQSSGLAAIFREWQEHFYHALNSPQRPEFSVHPMGGLEVNRRAFQDALNDQSHDIDVVVYLGHGLSCCLLARDSYVGGRGIDACHDCHVANRCTVRGRDHVILDEENYQMMEGRLIFMLACAAGRSLGQNLRKLNREKSGFFGFTERIYLYKNHSTTAEMRGILTEVLRILHGREGDWRDRYARAQRYFLDALLSGIKRGKDNHDISSFFLFSHLSRAFVFHPM